LVELQCRGGDLAVVTRDEPGLEANVGRLLWVYGPVREHPELAPVWDTVPATDEPMAYLAADGSIRFDRQGPSIVHPAGWMTPVAIPDYTLPRPARIQETVPLTKTWLQAVAASPRKQVYLELPSARSPETPRLTGRQVRARCRICRLPRFVGGPLRSLGFRGW
jgi:hypothetical protein